MIMRTWRGRTALEDRERYYAYLLKTGVPAIRSTPGNRGVWVLRRAVNGHAEFLMLSLWDSMGAVKAFAGDDPARAVFYPEDEDYLVEFDRHVGHYDVLLSPDAATP